MFTAVISKETSCVPCHTGCSRCVPAISCSTTELPIAAENRFKACSILHTEFRNSIRVLDAKDIQCGCMLKIDLGCFWAETCVDVDDVVHVIADWNRVDANSQNDYLTSSTDTAIFWCTIDGSNSNLLIVKPDVLVNTTSIASAVYCRRRAVLAERYTHCDSANIHLILGSLIHSVFQQACTDSVYRVSDLQQFVKSYLKSVDALNLLYSCSIQISQILADAHPYLVQISNWIRKFYIEKQPISPLNCKDLPNDYSVSIRSLHDIEDSVWSVRSGIRGRIDLALKASVKSRFSAEKVVFIPLELKTGKVSSAADHIGQVSLYNYMLAETYGQKMSGGLLLYIKDSTAQWVQTNDQNLNGLVQMRNELAHFLSQRTSTENGIFPLPEPINNKMWCEKCPYLLGCSLFQKSNSEKLNHSMEKLVPSVIGHLTSMELDYFQKWTSLLCHEWETGVKKQGKTKFWTIDQSERERNGTALISLYIVSQKMAENNVVKIIFQPKSRTLLSEGSMTNFSNGDMIILSNSSKKRYGLQYGFIADIKPDFVEINFEKKITFGQNDSFCVDKFETESSYIMNLSAVLNLMKNNQQCKWLRDLIIEPTKPEISTKINVDVVLKAKPYLRKLNDQQRKVVLSAFNCQNYLLLQGMPGTGKTVTISTLVKLFVQNGKSVLLTSYTHSAVDNLLLKLDSYDLEILRLGRENSIRAECRKYSAESHLKRRSSDETLEQALVRIYEKIPVVATTCLQAASHSLFSKRSPFDYCIVDEASLAVEPALLNVLLCAKKFILVGDPDQLRPIVSDGFARENGLAVSLFERLANAFPTNVFKLNKQYRMNSEICKLSSKLVYRNELRCASKTVADQTISVSMPNVLEKSWYGKILSSDLSEVVLFLDTSKIENAHHEQMARGSLQNPCEATLIVELCWLFKRAQLNLDDLGVICVYRQQITLVKEMMKNSTFFDTVEINTADQFQGRDKMVVIVSLVWTSANDKPTELLRDIRRLNVILTRAKCKLIIIGMRRALESLALFQTFFSNLDQNNVILC